MPNNRKIETLGVSFLSSFINSHNLLQTYFDSNDKTPAWDGEIHILKAATEKKSDIFGKVPVQIKTTQRNCRTLTKFQLSLNDLELYMKTGGVVLFVVWIDENNELKKIYYKSLPPFTIKNLIKRSKIKSTQDASRKKISIQIHELEKRIMYPMLCDFVNNSCKQFSFVKSKSLSNSELPKGKSFKFYHYGESPLGVFDYQKQHDLFVYVVDKETGVEIPMEESIEISEMFTETDLNVTIGDSFEFKNVTRHYFPSGVVELHIGSGFKLSCDEKEGKFTLNYNRPNLLSEAIYCTRALIDFKEKAFIKLTDSKIHFDSKSLKRLHLMKLDSYLDELLIISKTLKSIGVSKDIDLSLLNNSSRRNVDSFYKGLILGEKVKSNFVESKLLHLKVADAHIITMFQYIEPGLGIMIDIFKDTPWCRSEVNGDRKDISLFEALDVNDWLKIDNCNFDSVIESYQRLVDNKLNYESANNTIIKIVAASDMTDNALRRSLLLDWAQKLSEWNLKYFGSDNFSIINDLQIKSRIRDLTSDDNEILSNIMIDNLDDNEVCFGASVLLKSKPQADLYWNRLDKSVQDKYSEYPIYNLYRDI